MHRTKLSPRDYLKARRPERFSDSIVTPVSELDRGLLEYHLNSLTSRSQEKEFENFARALVKLEVCPNILPQTGPTGGGDSKVDSETYPVADSLAFAWYSGYGREASTERWAFAFSAKADWKSKLKSDIAKIATTNRGYKKGFFVTNQYVRDKVRGELEDDLSKKHKLDVRILDRTWILDVVFDHSRQEIAIKELGVSPSVRRDVRQLGPLDFEREAELTRIENRIRETVENETTTFVTVDDCIAAACISRELERPKLETVGRFERAENLASRFGTTRQKVQCAYDRAWTSFFWFEDIPEFVKQYSIVEHHSENSRNIYDLELLTNLWMLLHGHAQELCDYEKRTNTLLELLTKFSENDETPTAALEAKAFLSKIALVWASTNQKSCDAPLRELSAIFEKAQTLSGFPILPLAESLMALGEFLVDTPGYDALYLEIVETVARRNGEVEGARLLVKRAEQQLNTDRPVDAIRLLGNAFDRLAKDESKKLLEAALYSCACAYERIGLLWAARGALLMAASLSMSDLWRYEDITLFQAVCLGRLKWLELQLGRLPQVLAWHDTDSLICGVLVSQGYPENRLQEQNVQFDAVLGILLLKTDFWELKDLVRLPDQLSRMGLDASSTALLHALGHDSQYKNAILEDKQTEEVSSFFLKWRDQPASADLPARPDLCNQERVELRSKVLGCEICLKAPNAPPFVELGESLLAATECVLATGFARSLYARVAYLNVTIKHSDFCSEPFEYTIEDSSGYPHLFINCRGFNPDNLRLEDQLILKNKLLEVVAYAIGHILIPETSRLEELMRGDAAISRAINFSSSFQVLGNILGENRKRHISSWVEESDPAYDIKLLKPWDSDLPQVTRSPAEAQIPSEMSQPDKHNWTKRLESSSHSRVKFLSIIRESLWNKAKWIGTGFVVAPGYLPILALIFTEQEPARQIFNFWKEELGTNDQFDSIRVSIIRRLNTEESHSYRVVLGTNIDRADFGKVDFVQMVSRMQTMNPKSGENLDRFLEAYRSLGAFNLAPAFIKEGENFPQPIGDVRILKNHLTVREAWEIGVNDIDSVGILPNDRPIIPPGTDTPPVEALLNLKRRNAQEIAEREENNRVKIKNEHARHEKLKKSKEKRKRRQAKSSRKQNRRST